MAGSNRRSVSATSPQQVSVAAAKANLSSLITRVEKKHTSIVIMRRGVPVAQIAPLAGTPKAFVGSMLGTARELGDIVSPLGPDHEWTVSDWPSGSSPEDVQTDAD